MATYYFSALLAVRFIGGVP